MLKSKRIVALLVSALMLISMLPTFVFAQTGSVGIELDDFTNVTLTAEADYKNMATFTPEETGKYLFSVSNDQMENLNAVFYDNAEREGDPIWATYGSSFENSCYLYEGTTYYMYIYADTVTVTAPVIDVTVYTEPVTVESVEVSALPDMTYYDNELWKVSYWGLQVYVTFTDNSAEYYSYGDISDDGFEIECELDSDPESETYGTVTVSFGGKTDTFEITIIENPVKKFEYVGNAIEIVENTNCHEDYTYDDEPFKYYYNLGTLIDEQGEVFKVTYKDGAVEHYSLWDEDLVENWIDYYEDQYYQPWTKGGDNTMTAEYLGHEVEIPVKIVESPVKEVKITKAPSYVYTYGDPEDGYFSNGEYHLWPSYIDDLEFTVTLKDGTVKNYTGKDIEPLHDELDGVYCSLDYYIENVQVGKQTVTLNYNGVEAEYEITIAESSVKSVQLAKEPTVKTYSDYFTPSFAGAEVKLTYKDNSTKTIKVTKDNIYLEGDSVYVCDENEKAIVCFARVDDYEADERYYQLSCYGITQKLDCMEYVDEQYDSIELKNYNIDFEDMELVAVKNGTPETYKINNDVTRHYGFGGGDPDMKYYIANTYSDKGIFEFVCYVNLYNGVPASYHAHALGNSWNALVLEEEPVLQSISIEREPEKVRYEKGEDFDPTGIAVKVDYGSAGTGTVYYGYHEVEVSEVDTSTVGTKTVTVSFGGKTATFTIKVSDGFADVKKGSWYEKFVNYAASYGIFDGTDEVNNLFSPDMDMTRAQVVKILANLAGVNTSDNNVDAGFSDVAKGKWYTGAVKWAKEVGITEGVGDGTFRPDQKITREQLCVMLTSYVEDYMGCRFVKVRAGQTFKDDAQISSWAKASVDSCYRAGLIGGMGDGTFAPKANATRAQGATILAEFHSEWPIW